MPSDINLDIVLFAKHLLNILVEAKVNSKGAFSKGDLYEFQWCPWHSASAEVSIGEDKRSHKGPDVEKEAEPAGTDLDPHSWPLASHALEVCIRAVPVGQGHHDVQGGRAEHEVEHGVVVLHPLSLVVHCPPRPSVFLIAGAIGSRITEDHAVTS